MLIAFGLFLLLSAWLGSCYAKQSTSDEDLNIQDIEREYLMLADML